MDWINIVSGIFGLLGIGGCGILFYRETKRAKQIENEASTNNEWIKLYREVKDELSAQRDAKIELRNEIMALRVEIEKLRPWECQVKKCVKRVPPSPITMVD